MAFGLIMHRSVVEYFRARQHAGAVTPEDLRHLYEQQWRQAGWAFSDAYQQEQYRATGWQQLQEFHRYHAERETTVLDLEKTFEWPWEDDVVLRGRIDQINQLEGPDPVGVEVVEYKTGEPRSADKVKKDLQLALYALAAEKHLGYTPRRLTLYNLTANQPISFPPDEKETAKVLQRVRDVADAVRAGEFSPNPPFACRRCAYPLICPEFEQLVSAPAADEEEAIEEGNNT
jgi:RecB family exonuclease